MSSVKLPIEIEVGGDLHPYYVVDVFTDTPLEGNQLGVFADGRPFAAEQMQRIARELNLSETIFLLPPEQDGDARVRIFTPSGELPFAGHPIVGASFVLGTALGADDVRLETGLGTIAIRLERSGGEIVFAWMEHPVPPVALYERAEELLAALGLERSLLPVEVYENGPRHVYVQLPDDAAVAALKPDLGALLDHERVGTNCFAGSGTQWKTRMFGPPLGVAEDPATGSAAGPLAVHLARHGLVPLGTEIEISQGVEIGRPSKLHACAHDDRVEVGGSAVVVARGHYRVA
jgi:trans-2,3-dihydro-3-hydroxyanthranilate isomerase